MELRSRQLQGGHSWQGPVIRPFFLTISTQSMQGGFSGLSSHAVAGIVFLRSLFWFFCRRRTKERVDEWIYVVFGIITPGRL